MTRNPEIGNSPIYVLPNIWRLRRVRDTKFGTSVSNKKLLTAAKCQSYRFTVSESLRENLFMIGPFSTILLFLYPLKTLGGILEHYGTLWKISGILVQNESEVSFFPIFTVFLFLVTGGITLRFVIYYKKTFPITLNYYFAQASSFFFSPIFTVLLFLVTGDITLRFVIYAFPITTKPLLQS